MAGSHDSRGSVDRLTVVVLAVTFDLGLAHVEAHAHAQGPGDRPSLTLQFALGGQTGGKPVAGTAEDGHDAIARGLDHATALVLHRGPQDAVVLGQCGRHLMRKPLPEAGAALDIGEQESEGLGRRPRLEPSRDGGRRSETGQLTRHRSQLQSASDGSAARGAAARSRMIADQRTAR